MPIAKSLQGVPFFSGLDESLLNALAETATKASYDEGVRLFTEGGARNFIAVVVSGSVAIEKSHGGALSRLATLGAGEVVGEGLLLDESPHGTSGVAIEPTEVLLFRRVELVPLLARLPQLHAALLSRAARSIAQRLHVASATLVGHGRPAGFFGGGTRKEHDLLGERDVPNEALYGVQTLRALENFPLTGVPLREYPALIVALAQVKEAAAHANRDLGLLESNVTDAIVHAAREVQHGRHHEHFLVDMIQGGAGTSTNMNANEVIANRALELMGRRHGEYDFCHPNNHVNKSQSTNDVYPTAVKLALHASINGLREAMRELVDAFLGKGEEFRELVKMGRTQLQDAVPMTLGQEFAAFGHTIAEDIDRLGEAQALIREMNMGATAIGTRLNAPAGYPEAVRVHLSAITGLPLITAPDLVEATSDTGSFVQLSGVLKRCAVKLGKVCNDLRLLSSGPRAGLGEINLPPMQPGSSIMPGKVNPVIPEAVNQVCFDVVGGDVTVTMAAEGGQLQLNVFEPIIAYRLLHNIRTLTAAVRMLRTKCVEGITANPDRLRDFVQRSVGIVTALVPVIGYEACTSVAKEALESGRGVYELVLERGLLTREKLDEALDPARMV
ncbi:MAG: aspartate ammonia-lyase [Gemmatimonadaceae bacterium]|nr:aspartate ammonia-lyase [Gemmatimonadaceae bacterium]